MSSSHAPSPRFRRGHGRLGRSTLMLFGLGAALSLGLGVSCTGYIDQKSKDAEGGGSVGSGGGSSTGSDPGTRTGSFEGPIVSEPGASSRFIRLNHAQWENTVRDLLRLSEPLGMTSSFVAEPLRSTFDTNGSVLSVSSDLWRDYQTAAESVGEIAVSDSSVYAAIVPNTPADSAERAQAFIEQFGLRAFRRPLTNDEATRLLALFNRGAELINTGDDFADGVSLVVSYLLQSPHFLYRTEVSNAVVDGKVRLSDYEIASRLSYALTNTMPDDALFEAAAAGELQKREGVVEHARRLLESPLAEDMIENFHDQLLMMREFEQISKNANQYPEFSEGIGADARRESLEFVNHVAVEQELGLDELLTAPYTFANIRLAQIYGVSAPGADDTTFVKVDLDPGERAGVLTQVGFLAAHGEGATPNTIMRGVHIAHRILCSDLPPPPNAVPPLPELEPDSTNRQRVEELTKEPACAGCHATLINPLGFGLENLDGVGAYRSEENGQSIDAASSYELDGKSVSFDGPVEMMQAIAGSRQAHECYARHWVEYLYGREVDMEGGADRDLVQQGGWLSDSDASVKELIVNLIATDAFLTRLP